MALIKYKKHLFICSGKVCGAKSKPDEAKSFFRGKIREAGLENEIRACTASCLNLCDDAPNMVIYPEGTWCSRVEENQWQDVWDQVKSGVESK